jgi:hypothetical protein
MHFARLKQLNKRQVRWAISLSEFDFKICYHLGKMNDADAMSRRVNYTSIA